MSASAMLGCASTPAQAVFDLYGEALASKASPTTRRTRDTDQAIKAISNYSRCESASCEDDLARFVCALHLLSRLSVSERQQELGRLVYAAARGEHDIRTSIDLLARLQYVSPEVLQIRFIFTPAGDCGGLNDALSNGLALPLRSPRPMDENPQSENLPYKIPRWSPADFARLNRELSGAKHAGVGGSGEPCK